MTTRFTLRFMLCCFSEKLSDQISQQSISKINETENKLKTRGQTRALCLFSQDKMKDVEYYKCM